jgi:hypothetical protein
MKRKSISIFRAECDSCVFFRKDTGYATLTIDLMAIAHTEKFRDHTVIMYRDDSEYHRFVSATMVERPDRPPF